MAETRRYLPAQHLDLTQILQEAQHRWLRPTEICEILRNYQKFNLTPEPPTRPPAGSLFLFDRKALRYFRKDGHRWRKKKDGKTVKEAHEKLKAGSIDVLHCYYAHGEDNESFQRRSYWLLDGQLEHIVLVHYREVKEGYKAGISRLLADRVSQNDTNSAACFALNSPASTVQTSYASSANICDRSGQTVSSELEDVDSMGSLRGFTLPKPACHLALHDASFLSNENGELSAPSTSHPFSWFTRDNYNVNYGAPVLVEIPSANADRTNNQELFVDQKLYVEHPSVADIMTNKLADARSDADGKAIDTAFGNTLVPKSELQVAAASQLALENGSTVSCSPLLASSVTQVESKSNGGAKTEGCGELKKLDSFGRWMDKEIGGDCDDSLMASDSGNYWNTLTTENDDKEVSSLSRHMQLDIDSLGPSLSQEQLFSISDFSPDWAYSKMETKVLIIGAFLQSKDLSAKTKWSCMFGEIEVSAEILTDTSIRCVAPPHAPGRVPFYVTCSNRLACSEVREFEYREMPSTLNNDPREELHLQTRLAKLLHLSVDEQLLDCSAEKCDKCELKRAINSTRVMREDDTGRDKEASKLNRMCPRDAMIQSLLKDRLCRWLLCKVHEGRGPHILDEEGQGVMHLAAALGYEWAMDPIVSAGVNPNFRDVLGRTALHWASYFGREETVVALVQLGADPSVVDDPKPAFPGGQTAADLASGRGHKGIAAYLAEADLTSRLSLLSVNENLVDVFDNASETTIMPSDGANDEEISLKGSLAAVRKSARAAALIQDALRVRSFRLRQLTDSDNGRSEVSTDLVALGSLNKVAKMSCYEDYLHSAAIKIQQKYRGWKGRKEFLKIRNRIVKVQACVRGHQVRKHYKKVLWSVSIVEKVILRWRRKRVGLRAFRLENNTKGDSQSDGEKADEYDFLRIGWKQKFDGVERALARVKSMVRDPQARDQYMRLMTRFDDYKRVQGGTSAS